MAKEKDTAKKKKKRGRQERRFLPTSSTNNAIVYAIGALGALALGAGIYGYWFGHFERTEEQTITPILVLSVAGALCTVIAIWLGTSGEAAVRVGDPGIAREKGELRRMPWWAIDSLTWESGTESMVVVGKDEHERPLTFKLPVRVHGAAVKWLLQEANERVPKVVDVPKDVQSQMASPDPYAGTTIELEPMQVVGKRCAKSGKLIAYEPDARVCPRCERIYHKEKVPGKCKCGENLAHLKPKRAHDEPEESDEEESVDTESDTNDTASA